MMDGGVNKSNALLISIAIGMTIFGLMINFMELDIPGQYILGFSIFTLFLSIAEVRKNSLFKTLCLVGSVPLALSMTVFSLHNASYTAEHLSRLNNSFAIISLSMVLFTVVLSETNSNEK